ncbi:MAG: ABC transporter ATP-binding protein [Lachnospiraceae bacterium]|nr:ABC transporter ATP-binding protein [Lachnospiraceae bacterium]
MITCNHVSRKFTEPSGELWAVRDISLTVEDGTFLSIVGRSGSGKSTLLKMLGGLLMPTEGEVRIGDKSIYEMKDDERSDYRCNTVGFIFQDFFLEELYTVYQNLEIVLMIAGIPETERRERIEKALDQVGMLHKKDSKVKVLSGGEKQRVCIARAIINNPQIVFADEPCGNLDYENGQIIMNLLREQCRMGKTVVLITHNREDAGNTDRIITLQDGSIKSDETKRSVETDKK